MKKKPKEYTIDSFEKLCNNITPEKVDLLAVDFVMWLQHYSNIIQKIREQYPEETKLKTNWQIAGGSFIWIDDGKHDSIKLFVHNKQTGEVTEYKKK